MMYGDEAKVRKIHPDNLEAYWEVVGCKAASYFAARARAKGNRPAYEANEEVLARLLGAIRDALPSNPRRSAQPSVLDVGCGDGHPALYFARNGFKVVGIDLSLEAIAAARKNAADAGGDVAGRVHFEPMNVWDLSPDTVSALGSRRTFEVILLHQLLHQVRPARVRELRQRLEELLVPAGVFAVAVKHVEHDLLGRARAQGTAIAVDGDENVLDFRGFRPCHFFSEEVLEREFLHGTMHRLFSGGDDDNRRPMAVVSEPSKGNAMDRWKEHYVPRTLLAVASVQRRLTRTGRRDSDASTD